MGGRREGCVLCAAVLMGEETKRRDGMEWEDGGVSLYRGGRGRGGRS